MQKNPEESPKPKRHWLIKIILIIAAAFVILVIALVGIDKMLKPIKHPTYGVTFSKQRALELDLDWKANFTALLDDLKFKRFRLVSYWNEHEPQRSQFNFTDLDWQFNEAGKRGAKITLAVGLRQPRWPECRQPDWAKQLSGNAWKQALYAYLEVVVNRYKDNPALDSWQLENEGMNNWFFVCQQLDRTRLVEEFTLLKKLDPKHQVDMSLSDEHGLAFGQPVPDAYGLSIYRIVWNSKLPPYGYIEYPTPIWYHRLRAATIGAIQHRLLFIHEAQAEPWGNTDTKYLSLAEQDKSMSVDQIHKIFLFNRKIGLSPIDLWGGEWWYWRKVKFNDNSVWEAVHQELQK